MPRLHREAPSESSGRHELMADKEMGMVDDSDRGGGAEFGHFFLPTFDVAKMPKAELGNKEGVAGWLNQNCRPLCPFPYSCTPWPRADTAFLPAKMATVRAIYVCINPSLSSQVHKIPQFPRYQMRCKIKKVVMASSPFLISLRHGFLVACWHGFIVKIIRVQSF